MKRLAALLGIAVTAAPVVAQDSGGPATAQAREAIAGFGSCVARRSPEKAAATLRMDFRSHQYRSALRGLAEANRDCFRDRSTTMRADGLPFAAAIAEALLRSDPTPLNARIVRAAATEAATFGPSDRLAMCIARSDPDRVAALLTSSLASGQEAAAAQALSLARARCSASGARIELDAFGLRSTVATATYRLLAADRAGERDR